MAAKYWEFSIYIKDIMLAPSRVCYLEKDYVSLLTLFSTKGTKYANRFSCTHEGHEKQKKHIFLN